MARKYNNERPSIYIFCEGESEVAYANFLRKKFQNVATIQKPVIGLFDEVEARFKKEPRYRDNACVTDEIWFFFDAEVKDIPLWPKRLKIINYLRKLRKKPNIRVRLLMTTGCIEYWLMLHYKMYAPPLQTVSDKERVIHELKKEESTYEKGSKQATEKIAERYSFALPHGELTLKNLLSEGLPTMEDCDQRNQWLCETCKTFSTVQEAITYLESLSIV